MFWIYVLVGAALGAFGAFVYSTLTACKSGKASSATASGESGCPLCSPKAVNLFVGALVGAIAAVLITILVGPATCPFPPLNNTAQGLIKPEETGGKTQTPALAPASVEPAAQPESAGVKTPDAAKPEMKEERHYALALTGADFAKKTAKGIVIVDFWAEWCGPCHMQAPIFETLAKKYQGQVSFFKVNTDDEPGLSRPFADQGIPALAVFRDGKFLTRRVGYHDAVELEKLVKQAKDDPLPLLFPYVMQRE